MNSDKAWKYFGEKNPYYGVLTDSHFSSDTIDKSKRQEFFASGQLYVEELLQKIRDLYPSLANKSMCDFGCGVGRLTLPFADCFDNVVGVDISPAMLAEGEKIADEIGKKNIRWVQGDDNLTQVNADFDFVHSYIVLQHIPVKRGLGLIGLLLQRIAIGGVAAIHIVHSNQGKHLLQFIKRVPFLWYCSNILRKRPVFEPPMQMNSYPLEKVLRIFQDSGIDQVTLDFTNHGHSGCMIIGQKNIRDE